MNDTCAENVAMMALRNRADDILSRREPRPVAAQVEADAQKLIHELEVHHVELELQNAELRLARSELEAARNRYLELFEYAPVAYFVLSRGCVIQHANVAGGNLLGFACAKLSGIHFGSFVAPEDGPVLGQCVTSAFSRPGTAICHLALAGAGLEKLYVRLEALADLSGQSCRVVVLDLTERRRNEEALRAAAAEIEDLYQHAPCGYHSLDDRGYIRRMNDTELSWLGYSRDELLGKTMFQDLLSRASRRDFNSVFARELRYKGDLHNREWEIKCRGGRLLPILANAKVLRNLRGDVVESRWTVNELLLRRVAAPGRRSRIGRSPGVARRTQPLILAGVSVQPGW